MTLCLNSPFLEALHEVSGARPGMKVLDLAGGTGDLTAKFSHLVGDKGEVVLADINDSMLKVAH